MASRLTINQLSKEDSPEYLSDFQLIQILISDRQQTTTNPYSPLNERLKKLSGKLEEFSKSKKNIEDVISDNKFFNWEKTKS